MTPEQAQAQNEALKAHAAGTSPGKWKRKRRHRGDGKFQGIPKPGSTIESPEESAPDPVPSTVSPDPEPPCPESVPDQASIPSTPSDSEPETELSSPVRVQRWAPVSRRARTSQWPPTFRPDVRSVSLRPYPQSAMKAETMARLVQLANAKNLEIGKLAGMALAELGIRDPAAAFGSLEELGRVMWLVLFTQLDGVTYLNAPSTALVTEALLTPEPTYFGGRLVRAMAPLLLDAFVPEAQ